MTSNTVYKKGDIVKGKVCGITDFGIFVKISDGYVGLIHISAISNKFVKEPRLFVNEGDIINVEILDVNEKKRRMRLSIKNIRYKDKNFIDRRIVETEHGFATLKSNLPIWIKNNLKSEKN